MQFKSIISILAACASIVAAQDGTTTSTSTMTQTVTITQCNPSVTNCPGKTSSTTSSSSVVTPSSSWSYPLSNSTVSAGPTAYPNTTVIVSPTKSTITSVVIATTGSPTKTGASTLPTSGARALIAQSGLLMGVLGVGIAILA